MNLVYHFKARKHIPSRQSLVAFERSSSSWRSKVDTVPIKHKRKVGGGKQTRIIGKERRVNSLWPQWGTLKAGKTNAYCTVVLGSVHASSASLVTAVSLPKQPEEVTYY